MQTVRVVEGGNVGLVLKVLVLLGLIHISLVALLRRTAEHQSCNQQNRPDK